MFLVLVCAGALIAVGSYALAEESREVIRSSGEAPDEISNVSQDVVTSADEVKEPAPSEGEKTPSSDQGQPTYVSKTNDAKQIKKTLSTEEQKTSTPADGESAETTVAGVVEQNIAANIAGLAAPQGAVPISLAGDAKLAVPKQFSAAMVQNEKGNPGLMMPGGAAAFTREQKSQLGTQSHELKVRPLESKSELSSGKIPFIVPTKTALATPVRVDAAPPTYGLQEQANQMTTAGKMNMPPGIVQAGAIAQSGAAAPPYSTLGVHGTTASSSTPQPAFAGGTPAVGSLQPFTSPGTGGMGYNAGSFSSATTPTSGNAPLFPGTTGGGTLLAPAQGSLTGASSGASFQLFPSSTGNAFAAPTGMFGGSMPAATNVLSAADVALLNSITVPLTGLASSNTQNTFGTNAIGGALAATGTTSSTDPFASLGAVFTPTAAPSLTTTADATASTLTNLTATSTTASSTESFVANVQNNNTTTTTTNPLASPSS